MSAAGTTAGGLKLPGRMPRQLVGGWEVGLLTMMVLLYVAGAVLNPSFFGSTDALEPAAALSFSMEATASTLATMDALRQDLQTEYADYFEQNPDYELFADQASRTVEVPNVPNSVAIWQEFRDRYSESVIFGKTPPEQALSDAASKIDELASES